MESRAILLLKTEILTPFSQHGTYAMVIHFIQNINPSILS